MSLAAYFDVDAARAKNSKRSCLSHREVARGRREGGY